MGSVSVKIQDKKQRREKFSDDYILGYYDAIAEMQSKLGLTKASFDLAAYQSRISKRRDK